jgi:hypothetical protein
MTVFLDAEHFFDGFKANPDYALRTLVVAAGAGAACLVLCDTNGGALPDEVTKAVRAATKATNVPLGIHVHNDGGLAVANTLAAVRAGCRVQVLAKLAPADEAELLEPLRAAGCEAAGSPAAGCRRSPRRPCAPSARPGIESFRRR